MNAFIKQEGKFNGDLSIQKSLHTFATDVVNAIIKKNAGIIPVSKQDELTNTEVADLARWEDHQKKHQEYK